jgi:hypothetical protein
MRKLLNDEGRCMGEQCDERENCLRYIQRNSVGGRTSITESMKGQFEAGLECGQLIKLDIEK